MVEVARHLIPADLVGIRPTAVLAGHVAEVTGQLRAVEVAERIYTEVSIADLEVAGHM